MEFNYILNYYNYTKDNYTTDTLTQKELVTLKQGIAHKQEEQRLQVLHNAKKEYQELLNSNRPHKLISEIMYSKYGMEV